MTEILRMMVLGVMIALVIAIISLLGWLLGLPLVVQALGLTLLVGLATEFYSRLRKELDQYRLSKHYRGAFELGRDGYFHVTPEGKLLMANPAIARIFGYESAEELIANVADVQKQLHVVPENRQYIVQVLNREGILHDYKFSAYRRDGSTIWVSLSARAVRNYLGTIVSYEGTIEDISQNKRTEEELDTDREFLTTLLAKMRECVVRIDETGTVRYNPAAKDAHGEPPPPGTPPEQWPGKARLRRAGTMNELPWEEIPLYRAAFRGKRSSISRWPPRSPPASFGTTSRRPFRSAR